MTTVVAKALKSLLVFVDKKKDMFLIWLVFLLVSRFGFPFLCFLFYFVVKVDRIAYC